MAKRKSSKKRQKGLLIPNERIERSILMLRGQKVMLDMALANLYGVQTRALNQAVKRNLRRFPEDFMFRLSKEETQELNRSQTVTGSQKHRDPRYPPYAFTEQGVAMLSSVLRSERAVDVNVEIMRTFVRLRRLMDSHKDIAQKLKELEDRLGKHDENFQIVFDAIRQLMNPEPEKQKQKIGFRSH